MIWKRKDDILGDVEKFALFSSKYMSPRNWELSILQKQR